MRISAVMAGHPMPPEARADAEEMCRRVHRVVLTLSPLCHLPNAPATRPGGDGPEGAHALDEQESSLVGPRRGRAD
jgi:hypothetical protein